VPRAVLLIAVLAGCVKVSAPKPPPPPTVSTVRIGSWNIKRLGHGTTRFDLVAEVIEEEVDILAVEEVMTRAGVDALMKELPGWTAVVSDPPVGRNGYEERYAVLVRDGAATVTRQFTLDDPRDELVREPFVVCLAAKRFDFCLTAFHATFGDTTKERDLEIENLALLLMDERDATPEKDWIVAGDFNRPHTAGGFDQFEDAGWACVLPPALTSIGNAKYVSSYDHILVDPAHTKEWANTARAYDLVAAKCTGLFKWCKDEVSDHTPVIAVFTTSGTDDD
jgi:exonuclease III